MVGRRSTTVPEPASRQHTRYLAAGAVTLGIEGPTERGLTIHVHGSDDFHEYVRFDVFDDGPHYHYVHRTAPGEPVVNDVVEYDALANGDMLGWVLRSCRERLPAILAATGGEHIVEALDDEALVAVIDQLTDMVGP